VKVSIFIQDNLQSNTGVIYLPMNETAPPSVKKPGDITHFNSKGNISKEYNINLKLSSDYQQDKNIERVNIITTELGENIFSSEKKNKNNSSNNNFTSSSSYGNTSNTSINKNSNITTPNNSSLNYNPSSITKINTTNTNNVNNNSSNSNISPNQKTYSYLNDTEKRKENIEKVKKEFGQLADLLNLNTQVQDQSQVFKFDLFAKKGLNSFNKNQNEDYSNNNEDEDFIEIERENNLDRIRNMFNDFDLNKEGNNDGDDLLDLMDMAANN
jgi:hypothetical protein